MSARYKVVFHDLAQKPFVYFLFTRTGDRQALQYATAIHHQKHPDTLIDHVSSFEHLEGEEPLSTDFVAGLNQGDVRPIADDSAC